MIQCAWIVGVIKGFLLEQETIVVNDVEVYHSSNCAAVTITNQTRSTMTYSNIQEHVLQPSWCNAEMIR